MLRPQTRVALVQAINSAPNIRGAPIMYNSLCDLPQEVSPGDPSSPNYGRVTVVIDEVYDTTVTVPVSAQVIANKNSLGQELLGAGISCGFATVSTGLLVASIAAEGPSLGASTPVVVMSYAGAATGIVSCGNGLFRSYQVVFNPEDNSLQTLDSNVIYQRATLLNDAIGVASGVASLGMAGKQLFALWARQPSITYNGVLLTEEALRSLNRFERLKVIQKLTEEASATPEGRKVIEEALQQAQINAAKQSSGLSVQKATKVMNAVARVTEREAQAVADTAEAVLKAEYAMTRDSALFGGATLINALPSNLVGSASGSVNWIIHVVEAVDE